MKFLESHFWYNKGQRNGILFLLFCILCLQSLIHFGDFSGSEEADPQTMEFAALQKRMDSLQIAVKRGKMEIRNFNPNYLTDFKGYRIGLSPEQIDRLLAFRASGRFLHTAQEFQQVTGISDSLFSQVSPYLQFPSRKIRSGRGAEKRNTTVYTSTTDRILGDLNMANATELLAIPGVDEQLARRIVSYRKLIQGFREEGQLLEVYHLDKATAQRILERFPLKAQPEIKRLNVNAATFREVLKLPYIDYGLTRRIFRYRDSVKHIHSLEELKKLDSFPLEKFNRITLYLQAD